MGKPPKTQAEVVARLQQILKLGFVKTHRAGPTGIGKTLEDLLSLVENNVPGPDYELFELKSARKGTGSMLTLFTKSPLPDAANSTLLQDFGYPSKRGNGKKELHTTLSAKRRNTLKGKPGLEIEVSEDKIEITAPNGKVVGYWDQATLRKSFERKYPRLLYVKAEHHRRGAAELFWFNEAWFLWGFDFESFVALVKEDVVLVDIRIGQYPNGKPHDHGTGFRVMPDKLDLCFKHRKKAI